MNMKQSFEEERQANHQQFEQLKYESDIDWQKDNAHSLLKLFTYIRIVAIVIAIVVPIMIVVFIPWFKSFRSNLFLSILNWSNFICGIICEILAILAIFCSNIGIKEQQRKLIQLEKELTKIKA